MASPTAKLAAMVVFPTPPFPPRSVTLEDTEEEVDGVLSWVDDDVVEVRSLSVAPALALRGRQVAREAAMDRTPSLPRGAHGLLMAGASTLTILVAPIVTAFDRKSGISRNF